MKNLFNVGAKYNAAQNISRLALANNHAPLFYKGLVYEGFEKDGNGLIEHVFTYEGEKKWFDDDSINTGQSEDNSMVFGQIN